MPGLYTISVAVVLPMIDNKKPNLKLVINGKVVAVSYGKKPETIHTSGTDIDEVPQVQISLVEELPAKELMAK